MTSILGNANCSLQVTSSTLELQLDQIAAITLTHGSTDIDFNSYKITNIANATSATDALNKQTADALYQAIGTAGGSISSLDPPTEDFAFAGYKLTNLGNATTDTDALNRQTADVRYYSQSTTLDSITAPTASVSLNSQKLTNLATPTISTDAASKGYVDDNFYANTTTLDSITAPTASVSLNSQKITDLAAATSGTDALNRDTADARYMQATPSGDVDFNGYKLVNVAPGTELGDVMVREQDKFLACGMMYTASNITAGISFPYVVPFSAFYTPTRPTGAPNWIQNPSDGVLKVGVTGNYRAEVNLITQYSDRTDKPVTVKIQRYDSNMNAINTLSFNNVDIPTARAPALNTKVATTYSQMFSLSAGQSIQLLLTGSDSTLAMVAAGSSVSIQLIE